MGETAQDTLLDRVRKAIAGIQKRFPNGTIQFQGQSFTSAALIALFQSLIDAVLAAQAAEASRRAAVEAAKAARAKILPIFRQFLRHIRDQFGNVAPDLADFGLVPTHARKVPTVETKVVAKQAREATRELRHTMGTRQKQKVKAGAPQAPATTGSGSGSPATQSGSATKPNS